SLCDTVAAIRAQAGLVYLPHPFDRLHAIPTPATLHRHLAEIDARAVYNARLLFGAYNEEALASAGNYNLTPGAGSTAPSRRGLGDERAQASGGTRVPVLCSGHPLADVFVL